MEPKIAHLKSDHRMNRCFLAGLQGDAINAILAAAGSNLRKLLRRLAAALIRWFTFATWASGLTSDSLARAFHCEHNRRLYA